MSSADEDLLQILNAHGQQFLSSFDFPPALSSKKRKHEDSPSRSAKIPKIQPVDDDSDEWSGIHEDETDEEHDTEDEFEQEDDEFTSGTATQSVVVFSDTVFKSGQSNLTSKAQKKAFMSSKVSKLREQPGVEQPEVSTKDEEDERTNAQNDALLHRLVHTKLLSGSLNTDLDLTRAQRKKSLAGRVLELSGQAKLGKGEKAVREAERNKASKRVREGLLDKQKQRQQQQLEEAKNLGNYHPTIKSLFEANGSSSAPKKIRERGLKMGVGKFSGGMLKLSKDEISRVQGGGAHRGGGGGRGRGRGGRGRGAPRGRR